MQVGDRIDRLMVIAKKVRREFSGGTFLLFQFTDREGSLGGVLWDPPEHVERAIQTNDVVRVKGEIQEYQGSLQLKVGRIERVDESEVDPSDFLPASARSLDQIYDEILEMINAMFDEHLCALLMNIFGDAGFRKNFLRAPAAKGWHHAYVGGLAEHVYDMARLALKTAEVYTDVDRDLLMAGVFLHDVGKLQELSVTNHIEYSDRGRLLGHITMGIEFIESYLRGMGDFPGELELRLKHMILSHHGTLENGSPVVPMTIEALLLHYIDNMDAQVRGALQVLEKNNRRDEVWTEYVRLLDRFIYRGRGDHHPATGGERGDDDG